MHVQGRREWEEEKRRKEELGTEERDFGSFLCRVETFFLFNLGNRDESTLIYGRRSVIGKRDYSLTMSCISELLPFEAWPVDEPSNAQLGKSETDWDNANNNHVHY